MYIKSFFLLGTTDDIFSVFQSFVMADVLIPGRGTFSDAGGQLNSNVILCDSMYNSACVGENGRAVDIS